MRLSTSIIVSTLLVGAASVSANSHTSRHSKRHHDLAAREPKPEPVEERAADAGNATDVGLGKRANDARFTYYAVGLGACGITNSPSDFIVALNSDQYGSGSPGPQCFKMITISYGGKTATAQITDECPGCPYRGLDMSSGLFTYFAAESEGVLYGDWWYNDDSGSGSGDQTTSSTWSSSSTQWTPTTTWTPTTSSTQWTPTTTWSSTKTSSSWSSSSTWSSSSSWSSSSTWSSSSSSWTSSATSSSLYDLSSGPASGLAVSTGSGEIPTATGVASENIYNMNLAIIDMGAIINAGAQL